jgi:hypothetical protein
MPELGNSYNLMDLARLTLSDGKLAKVYDQVTKNTPIIRDLMMVQCNKIDIFEHVELTGLPVSYYVQLGQGFPKSKASTKVVKDSVARIGNRFEVDRETARLSGNTAEFMAKQELFHIKSAMEKIEETIIYGVSTDPDQFIGTHARMSTPSADRTQAGYNIIDGGGTGSDNMSVLGIVHSTETFHGIYPQGQKSGLEIDRIDSINGSDGVPITDTVDSTRELMGYKRHVQQLLGLAVPDWHGIVRIANIDNSLLIKDASTGADLNNLFQRMAIRMNRVKIGMKKIYVNDTVYSFIMQQLSSTVGGNVGFSQVQGQEQVQFWGIPIEVTDTLTIAEEAVTGTFSKV